MAIEENTNPNPQTGQLPGQQSGGSGEGGSQPTGTQPGASEKQTTQTPQGGQTSEQTFTQAQLDSIIAKRLEDDRKAQKKAADEENQKKQGQYEPLYNTLKQEHETYKTDAESKITAANKERDDIKTTLAGYVKADLLTLTPELLKLTPVDVGDKPEDFDVTKLSLADLKTLGGWIAKAKGTLKPEDGQADRTKKGTPPGANRGGPPPTKPGPDDKQLEAAKASQRKRLRLTF